MTKFLYTQEQIMLLKANQYVKDCGPRYCSFTDHCKLEALKLDEQGWYFRDIFRQFGFPDFFVESQIPKQTIKNWRHTLKTKGISQMIGTKKGRKKQERIDISRMNKDEYIAYLEAKTAYLEELQHMIHGQDP